MIKLNFPDSNVKFINNWNLYTVISYEKISLSTFLGVWYSNRISWAYKVNQTKSNHLKLPRAARRPVRIYRQRISTTQKTKSRRHDANSRQSFVHARIREGTVSIGQLRIESKQVEAVAATAVHFYSSMRIMKSYTCIHTWMFKIRHTLNQTWNIGKIISRSKLRELP